MQRRGLEGLRVPAVARLWLRERRRETQSPAQGRPEEMGLRRAAQREETGAARWRTTSAGKEPNLWRKMNNLPPLLRLNPLLMAKSSARGEPVSPAEGPVLLLSFVKQN